MGIYIREMAMPKSCKECPLSDHEAWCLIPGDWRKRYYCPSDEVSSDCPLVEVPEPHGDLIDRDSLMRTLAENKDYFEHENVNCCCYFRNSADEPSTELWCVDEWVDGQPTIIERSEDDKI